MRDPMFCDRNGKPLEVGDTVRLVDDYDEHVDNVGRRTGLVRAMPRAGSDWYGFPSVAFDGAKKTVHRVPNSALLKRDPVTSTQIAAKARALAEGSEQAMEDYVVAERQYREEANTEIDVSDKAAAARDDAAVRLVEQLVPIWELFVPEVMRDRMKEILDDD